MADPFQSVLDDWSLPIGLTLTISLTARLSARLACASKDSSHTIQTIGFWHFLQDSPAFGSLSPRRSKLLPMSC